MLKNWVPLLLIQLIFMVILPEGIRADRSFSWGSTQVSGILPVLSGRNDNDLELIPGWGLSASLVIVDDVEMVYEE